MVHLGNIFKFSLPPKAKVGSTKTKIICLPTFILDSENYWVTCNHYDHCVEHMTLLSWVAMVLFLCDILLLFCSFFLPTVVVL